MPRQARLDVPGTLHHVMIRGIEGANIFWDDKDRERFLFRVGEIGKATGVGGGRIGSEPWGMVEGVITQEPK